MRSWIVAAFILAISARPSFACSCAGSQPFEQAARGAVVVHGIVRSYIRAPEIRHAVAMNVDVLHVLQGNYRAKTIKIVGDFGMSCVPYVENFPIDTEWVFAVGGPLEIERFGNDNYTFGICAAAGVPAIDGRVTMSIGDSLAEMTLDELRDFLCDPTAASISWRPPFASIAKSNDDGVTPPRLSGSNEVQVPPPCTAANPLRLDLVIDAAGAVRNLKFAGDEANCVYQAVAAATRTWKFIPAMRGGNAIAVRHSVAITFR